jgi:hypothetical protein
MVSNLLDFRHMIAADASRSVALVANSVLAVAVALAFAPVYGGG